MKERGDGKLRVLFICTHNSARSQMAEGFLRHLYGDRYEAESAGTDPEGVHPLAVEVMREVGIDISTHRSRSVQEFWGQEFDLVVTVCDHAKETCPFFPGKRVIHRGFEDPSGGGIEDFRRVRDEIGEWIEEFFGREFQESSSST